MNLYPDMNHYILYTDSKESQLCRFGRTCKYVYEGKCMNRHRYRQKIKFKQKKLENELLLEIKIDENEIVLKCMKEKVQKLELEMDVRQKRIKELQKQLSRKKYVYKAQQVPRDWITQVMQENAKYGEFWENKVSRLLGKQLNKRFVVQFGVLKEAVQEIIQQILDEEKDDSDQMEDQCMKEPYGQYEQEDT